MVMEDGLRKAIELTTEAFEKHLALGRTDPHEAEKHLFASGVLADLLTALKKEAKSCLLGAQER